MAPKKQLRQVSGIFKDKFSLIKTTLSTKPSTSTVIIAVLRCTTHFSTTSPPPHRRISALLSLTNNSHHDIACIEAIMNRLHNTQNAYVALKCLYTLHNIFTKASFMLIDYYSLNLSMFFDNSDIETWELSLWVRWYVIVLECNLNASRINSSCLSYKYEVCELTTLLRGIKALVIFVEEICRYPESLHLLRNDLVYEIVKMTSEDYRLTQHYLMNRLSELGGRMDGLTRDEYVDLTQFLERLEECKERLTLLFANRKQNAAFWELVRETKKDICRKIERRLVIKCESESTRLAGRVVTQAPVLRLPYWENCLSIDRVHPMALV